MPQEPTRYERELMVSLGFETLEELIEFLNLPPHPDLDKTMHPPDTSASERWDRFLEDEWEKEQAQKKKQEGL